MKRTILLSLLLALLAADAAEAHEHWIALDDFYPEEGDTTGFSICSGHSFPSSSIVLKDQVIDISYHVSPGGKEIEPLESAAEERSRTGTFIPSCPGVHILVFVLKRPKADRPSFEAKAVSVVGGGRDDRKSYILGKGLEICLGLSVTKLKKGAEVDVSMTLDGEPVEGEITLTSKKGKNIYRRAGIGSPAAVPLIDSGICMISGSFKGRGCSLVFCVPDQNVEE